MIREIICTWLVAGLTSGWLIQAEPPPAALAAWLFDRPQQLDGWMPNQDLADVEVRAGSLHARAVGADPILEYQPDLNLPAAPWDVVELRLKADRDGVAELFWSNTRQGRYGGFSQEKSARFPVRGDGEWRVYRVRPCWHAEHRIQRLRLDLYDAATFELDSLQVLQPAVAEAPVPADFSFAQGPAGWRAEDGAALSQPVPGSLRIELRGPGGFIAAPRVDEDAAPRSWLNVQLAADRGHTATLLFATTHQPGLQRFAFPIQADGRMHSYSLHLQSAAAWRGRIVALGFRPSDDPAAAAHLAQFRLSGEPQGAPNLVVKRFELEEALARAGRPADLVGTLENRGGSAATGLAAWVTLPRGVRLVATSTAPELPLPPGEERSLRWSVEAARPVIGEARLRLRSSDGAVAQASARLEFTPRPAGAEVGYVPEPRPVRGPFEVGAFYFPGWPSDTQWKPIRRFPERRPLLGWYAEGASEVADWHIKWAVEHGLTFFAYDWYWSRGHRQLEHALHQGYFQARYRQLLKFCLLWANHNAPGTSSLDDCLEVTRFWIANYFRRPEHLTLDGKPLLIVFAPQRLTEDLGASNVRSTLEAMRSECRAAGLPGLFLAACVGDAAQARQAAAEGYDAVTGYNWPHLGVPAGEWRAPYADLLPGYRRQWSHIAESAGIPLLPPACGGWDSRPWHGENNYVRPDRTPALFRQHLRDARHFLEATPAPECTRSVLLIEAWNEWGEGSYIEPQREFGFGYLDAVREALTDAPHEHEDLVPGDVGRRLLEIPEPGTGGPKLGAGS